MLQGVKASKFLAITCQTTCNTPDPDVPPRRWWAHCEVAKCHFFGLRRWAPFPDQAPGGHPGLPVPAPWCAPHHSLLNNTSPETTFSLGEPPRGFSFQTTQLPRSQRYTNPSVVRWQFTRQIQSTGTTRLRWRISIYQPVYVLTLTYGLELFVVTKGIRSEIQEAKLKFDRRVAGP